MKAFTMRGTFLTILCFISFLLFGQSNQDISESLVDLNDKQIKNEVASFTIKGSSLRTPDSLYKVALAEIPIRNCSGKKVYLSWSTFTSTVNTFIHLYFKSKTTDNILDSISLVTHSHFRVKIPKEAYQGLSQSNSCNFDGGRKKSTFSSQYYKAFYSADRKRLYIYMLGGGDTSKYEVTWIIVGDKYYTRVLDPIHDQANEIPLY